jgi:glutathione peroxidase
MRIGRALRWSCALVLLALAIAVAEQKEEVVNTLHDIEVQRITGEGVKLGHYKGKVLLIVNTASKCGFTGQYDGLQKLFETYEEKGLVVLGFPSNDFLRQEPGNNEEIQSFCRLNYGVTFPLFAKIKIKGAKAHPLYRFLVSEKTNPGFGGKISWNFNKFLVDRDGKVIGRFGSRIEPGSKEIINAVEAVLSSK